MGCPLCGQPDWSPSWIGGTAYLGQVFPYVQCAECRSLYCAPMPDDDVLRRLYGADYANAGADAAVEDPKQPGRVLEYLSSRPPGTFVDFGCGSGLLLREAGRLGWTSFGVEYDPGIAEAAARTTGVPVFAAGAIPASLRADVLHLGDVIEHLTQLDTQMPRILDLLAPRGVLLAQGPLEANPTVFNLAVRAARLLRRRREASMPPYHVLLATRRGQRRFFERFGLYELTFSLSEVAWPAPSRLGTRDLRSPRRVGLFLASVASRTASRLAPRRLGNRYFYVGTRRG